MDHRLEQLRRPGQLGPAEHQFRLTGTTAIAQLDPLNSQPWSVVWDSYDNLGNWNQQGITFDDGTMAAQVSTRSISTPWSAVWDEYYHLGNWVTQSVELDDGTSSVAYLDPVASDTWSVVYNNYDDVGNWTSQNIEFKDGTSAVAYLDPLGSQPWSLVLDIIRQPWQLGVAKHCNSRTAPSRSLFSTCSIDSPGQWSGTITTRRRVDLAKHGNLTTVPLAIRTLTGPTPTPGSAIITPTTAAIR